MATAFVAPLTMDQSNMPAWGSYLYQNFLLPAFSPNIASQWLTSPFGNSGNDQQQQQQSQSQQQQSGNVGQSGNNPQSLGVPGDYFGSSWQVKPEPGLPSSHHQAPPLQSVQSFQTQPPSYSASQQQPQQPPAPQSQQPQPQQSWAFFGASIPTSLLTANQPQNYYGDYKQPVDVKPPPVPYPNQASGSRTGSAKISPTESVEVIDEIVASPSPLLSSRNSPHPSPKKGKRRALSIDSNEDHYGDEQDHEVPEGVEKDGMIWGMRVEDYRALSARERKRVRNRISARTFRAKRKEHLSSLESTLNSKDVQIKVARDDAERLRREVENLKRRLSKYEKV